MKLRIPPAEWISQKSGHRSVLIHGMTMSPGFWHEFAPDAVKNGFSCAYPLPGHYPWVLSDEERVSLNTEAMLEAYSEAIERDFGSQPVTLIGHSTGAYMCLLLARHRPDLVSGVVLAGGFGCGRFEGQESISTRILGFPLLGLVIFLKLFSWWISTPKNFRSGALNCVFDPDCPWESENTVASMELVRTHLLQSNPLDIAAMAAWIREQRFMDKLTEIRQPVLNIIGVHDRVVPALHQLHISQKLPQAQTVLISDAGHLPMVEHNRHFSALVDRFIEGNALKSALESIEGKGARATLATRMAGQVNDNEAPSPAFANAILHADYPASQVGAFH